MNSLFSLFLVILICFNQILGQETKNIVSKIQNGIIFNESISIFNSKNSEKNDLVSVNSGPFLDLESFEDTENFPPLDWINWIDPSQLYSWEQGYNSYDGDYAAFFNGGSYSDGEAWLITPQIDLSTASNAILTYYDDFDDSYGETDQDDFSVLISTNYSGSDDPNLATWTTIHSGLTEYNNWNLQEVDLSSYLGQSVYIAFRYTPYFDGFDYIPGTDWYIDAVRVSDDGCTGIELVPNAATVDSPPNGATLIPVDVPLTWIPPYGDFTKQLLYFGTDGGGTTTPTNIYNGTEFSIYAIGLTIYNLSPNTTYYWQVVPANCSYEALNCPIWSFTTGDGNLNYGGGGPTQDNYYFENSISGTSHQPAFNWIDISSTGTDLITSINDDQTKGSFPLGFDFDFFGNTYSTFYINANGFVSFGYPNGQVSYGFTMPSTFGPENLIAGFWMSLNPNNPSVTDQHLYYGTHNGDMVITFKKFPQYFSNNNPGDADAWITFQIIIKQNGNIKIQYK
ncbi:MAG: choice-of-anchor J domain-containing protein, partial [Ignavibacteriae bacterium]|nr:choice-of-anchor J domain-containing protein [Ignavibacteriota bacterium]